MMRVHVDSGLKTFEEHVKGIEYICEFEKS